MNRRPRRSREWLRQGIAVGMTPAFWAATPVEAQALPSDVVSSFKNAFGQPGRSCGRFEWRLRTLLCLCLVFPE